MALTSREYNKQRKKKKSGPSFIQSAKNSFNNFKDFFGNEKLHQVIGFIFVTISLFMLIAFCSFLFTWKIDQDKVTSSWLVFLFNPEIEVHNWLGKVGTIISHQFIHNWFGISSFLFIPISFLVGFKIFAKISVIPVRKFIAHALFALIWLSALFGYLYNGDYLFLGGTIGYQINIWLVSIFGVIGTGLLLILFLLVYSIVAFNFINFVSHLLKGRKEDEVKTEGSVTDEWTTVNKEESPLPTTLPDSDSPEEEKEEKVAIDLGSTTAETPKETTPTGDVSMSVEEAKDDAVTLSGSELNKKVKDFGEYDETLELNSYELPSIDLLKDYKSNDEGVDQEELDGNKERIISILGNHNVEISSIKATIGPTVTLYEVVPAPGIRIAKIKSLEDDIAMTLSATGIRIIAPIPGKGTVGIEVPNLNPDIVSMRTIIASDKFQNSDMELPIGLGKTISNETFVVDLTAMPHLLMAGATGQGKSVGLNAILVSLLYKKHPSQLKFVLVDPKKVELTLFNKIERHFLAKLPDSAEAIITDTTTVVHTLVAMGTEMDQRYELLKNAGTRNIKEYNTKFINRKLNPENGHRYLPYIVLVVDEFADLIMTAGREVETPIARLAQLARAIGIHLIIATQRPSVNIITGTIKANFPARIAFRVTSKIDSRTILDAGGADQLIGKGDMLMAYGSKVVRLQCAFVDTPEVEEITDFIGNQRGYPDAFLLPEYVDESASQGGDLNADDRDSMFEDAAHVVVSNQQGSTSLIQRKLKLGYNRAGRIIDQLEDAGIVGRFEGSKARQVLIPDEASLEHFLKGLDEKPTEEEG